MNNLINGIILLFLRAESANENLKNRKFPLVFPQIVGLLSIYFQHHENLHSFVDSHEGSSLAIDRNFIKYAFDMGKLSKQNK